MPHTWITAYLAAGFWRCSTSKLYFADTKISMDEELVLLTSYFNLVDGRRQDTADTFRVDPNVPSSTAPDGTAALYVITEASAAGQMGPRARRLAADTVAWEYASHNDDPPAARIKSALRAADEAVRQQFDGHVAVGLSVIAVEGDSVYLGQVAPAQVYVLHDGSLHSIAATGDGSVPFARAIGSNEGPQISVFRDQVGPGDVVALCSSWFHRALDAADLRDCFSAATADDITDCLLQLAKSHDASVATAVVIEAVPASELEDDRGEKMPGFAEQIDTAVQALAGIGRMLWMELRAVPPPPESNGKHAQDGAHPIERPSGNEAPAPNRAPVPAPARATMESPPSDEEEPVVFQDWETTVASLPAEEGEAPVERDLHHHQMTEEVPIIRPDPASWDEDITGEIPIIQEPSAPSVIEDERGLSGATPVPAPDLTPAVPTEWDPAAELSTMVEAAPEQEIGLKAQEQDIAPEAAPQSEIEVAPEPEPEIEAMPEPEPSRAAEPVSRSGSTPLSEMEQVNSRLHDGPNMGDVIPPVQAFPDTGIQPERIYATSKDIQAVNKRPRRFGGMARPGGRDPLNGPTVIRPNLGSVDLDRPSSGGQAPPMAIWAGIALVVLLAAGSLYLFLHHRHAIAINPYPALVSQDISRARQAKAGSNQNYYLAHAHRNLALAIHTGADAGQIQLLQHRLLSTEDLLHHITRVANPVVLANFARISGAQPGEVAAAPGLAFVLDTGRKKVLSFSANSPGSGPTTILDTGEVDSGFTIGTPMQIATAGSTALIFDDHNTLIRDQAGTKTATALTEPNQGEKIVAMATEDPDVYLLDAGTSQVWRYPGATAGFNPTAESYFGSAAPPPLGHADSLAMDGTDMFILLSTGSVLKYDNQANAQKFTTNLRTPLQNPTAISTAPGLADLWIADPAHGRIVQLNKSGGYVRTYVSGTSGMDLHQIKGMAIGPAGNTLYVVVGSKLVDFNVTP
jgi:hypothetical protein